MRRILPLLLLLFVIQTEIQAASFDNVTILVTSCDKYSSLWGGFFQQLFQKWPELKGADQNVPIHLVANEKAYNDSRIFTSHTFKKESWSDNILHALQDVKTDYVLILLEDYYLTRFDRERLMDIYAYMRSHPTVSYIEITQNSNAQLAQPVDEVPGLCHKVKHSRWRTSLQPCLWRKADLQHLLRPGETAWEFEILGSVRSEGLRGDFLVLTHGAPLSHLNVVHEGYVYEATIDLAKTNDIELDVDFPYERDHKFQLWLEHGSPLPILEICHRLKKIHKKYLVPILSGGENS